MALINKEISEFKCDAYRKGEGFITVNSEDLKGHWSVLVFYPADFTFVCPTELEDLQDHYKDFQDINCEVYSVSTDSHFVHKAWADASENIGKIEYTMLSDRNKELSESLGVLIENEGNALRASFVIDPNGVIQAYEIHNLGIGRSAAELLRKVQAAQFVAEHGDQVCPAKWKPGDETLTPGIDLVGKL